MTEMNKIKQVMLAVMAALRTFGIEFDTNVSGFDTNKETKKEHVVKYNMFAKPPLDCLKGYRGKSWQLWDNREGVWVELHKLTPPTEEQELDWGNFYGFSSYIEAQYAIGDMPWHEDHITFEIPFGHLESFVESVAPYCWSQDN